MVAPRVRDGPAYVHPPRRRSRNDAKAGSSQCLRRTVPRSGISALGSAGLQREFVSVEQDCVAYSRTALFGDGRLRTTKPGFVDGAEAVISGCVSVIDRCGLPRGSPSQTISLGRSSTCM